MDQLIEQYIAELEACLNQRFFKNFSLDQKMWYYEGWLNGFERHTFFLNDEQISQVKNYFSSRIGELREKDSQIVYQKGK